MSAVKCMITEPVKMLPFVKLNGL